MEARETFRLQMEQNRETFRKTLSKEREAFKGRSKEDKEKFWNGAKRMIGERFTAAVTNLERMQNKVGEVITRVEAQGKNTDEAETALDLSKSKLADAKKKIEEIQKLIPASGTAVTPELFEQIKLKAREAKDLLKESHEALKNAIKSLRELRGENKEEGAVKESE
jgi:hypothetical protein